MQRIILILLFLTGAAEVYYVAFVVNFSLYAGEPLVARVTEGKALTKVDQIAFGRFYDGLGGQWDFVGWCGLLTMFLAIVPALMSTVSGSVKRKRNIAQQDAPSNGG